LGISADEQTAYFLLVDGNEAAGTGCTLDEAAEILMAEQPMEIIVNLDGGGSTTGVRKGPEGKPLLFNVPSDDNVAGIQRLVATQVGISFN
jgi:exopolysaccharide biosynthesis protein